MCDTLRIVMSEPFSILRTYRQQKGLSAADFAKSLGIAEVTLRSLENGTRVITAERAAEIEDKTGGEITRHDLRPDLFGERAAA